jgi:hypothetical protein
VKIETTKAREISGITAADVKFLRKTAKHALFDHKRNEDDLEGLETQAVLLRTNSCKSKGVQHLGRMDRPSPSQDIMKYRLTGESKARRPIKETWGLLC